MSRTKSNTFGLEHGKIGNRVAVVLNGMQVYKGAYRPTNPRTPKQQMHRAKLAFANRLSAHLAGVVNLGFAQAPEPGSGQSPRNAFVKKNWDNGALVWVEAADNDAPGMWTLCPEQLCVAVGPRHMAVGMQAEVCDGQLRVVCPDPGMGDSYAVGDDRLYVAAYFPAVPEMLLYEGPLRQECGECRFDLPQEATDGAMHVYAWFVATRYHRTAGGKVTVHPGQASRSVFLGTF